MLGLVLTAVLLVAANVAIHAFGTTAWLRHLMRRYAGPDGNFKAHAALPAVTFTALVLIGWSTALLFLIVQRSWQGITQGL
jgi:uncharacterized membrane protein